MGDLVITWLSIFTLYSTAMIVFMMVTTIDAMSACTDLGVGSLGIASVQVLVLVSMTLKISVVDVALLIVSPDVTL